MCIVFSIVGLVYWYQMVTLLSMIVGESLYVSFLRSSFLCIHFVISLWEWDEWPFPRSSRSLSFPSLHSLLMWLHSMFDLSWSSLFFVYSLFRYHPCHCLWFISFPSSFCSFLTLTYSRFDISLASFLCISLSIWFASSSHYWYYIHIGHPQVHSSQAFLYMLHFIHEGMGFFIIGYLGLVSLHFYYPITLAYITSSVLRPPWGNGIRFRLRQPLLGHVFEIWLIFSIIILLLGDASLMFGPDSVVDMDNLMLFDFSIYHTFDVILRHISLSVETIDFHGVAWSSPLTRYTSRRWPVCYLIMIP